MFGNRGRMTLPDLMFGLASLAVLGALYPVFWDSIQARAGEMTTAQLYMYQLILPLALLVFLGGLYRKAVGGAL